MNTDRNQPIRTHRGRLTPPADPPVSNLILAALLATENKRLLPRLEHVTLKRGEIVYRADQLGNKSCECYRFIRQEYERLHRELPRLLSRVEQTC